MVINLPGPTGGANEKIIDDLELFSQLPFTRSALIRIELTGVISKGFGDM